MNAASATVVHVPPWACARRMRPGEVRRWAFKGKSFSYVICCPRCTRTTMHMVEEMGLTEGPLATSTASLGDHPNAARMPFEYPTTMTSARESLCQGCGGTLRFEGGTLSVEPPKPRG